MREIQSLSDGWSEPTYSRWYECETMDEYQQMLDKYTSEFSVYAERFNEAAARRGNEDWWNWSGEDYWNAGFLHKVWGLTTDIEINETPKSRCSDGWHYSVGNYIKGRGFRVYKQYERSSENLYILQPGCQVKSSDYEEYYG